MLRGTYLATKTKIAHLQHLTTLSRPNKRASEVIAPPQVPPKVHTFVLAYWRPKGCFDPSTPLTKVDGIAGGGFGPLTPRCAGPGPPTTVYCG